MKTLFKFIGSCLFIVIACLSVKAQIIYFNTSQGDIYTIDASNCDLQFIDNFTLPNGNNASFEDIAFTENGVLIGVDDGDLYEIDLALGTVTDLGITVTGDFITGLVGAGGNTLYAAGGSLHFIDLDAGTVNNLGSLPQSSAGDLAFNNGELYMAAEFNNLYQINIANPGASTNVGQMNVGGATIFGIVSSSENCTPTQTFATSNQNDLYNVSVASAGTAIICPNILPNGNSIFGAATTTDFESSACSLSLDLDTDDSSGATNADFFGVTQCNNNPAAIADLDLSLTTDDAIDSIQIFISSGIIDAAAEVLVFVDNFPNIDFIVNSPISITLVNNGAATEQEFIDAILAINFENSTPNFSQGTRQITVIAFADNLATDPAIASITLNAPANLDVNLGIDQQFCDQANFTLDATQNFPNLTYQWSTGPVSETLTVTTSGTYSVVVTDNLCGGTDTDEVTITFNNSVNETETLVACQGENATFDGTDILAGQSQQFQYLTTAGCDSTIDVSVDIHPVIDAEIIEEELSIEVGESIEITTNIDATSTQSIEWQSALTLDCSDCPNPIASPISTSTYNLTVTDINGCSYTDAILINVEIPPPPPVVEEPLPVLIPNAFSPNEDGFNDLFSPVLFEAFDNFELRIYNRWGQNVFSTNSPTLGWDGNFNGEKCELGVYMYYVSINFIEWGAFEAKGNVTVLR